MARAQSAVDQVVGKLFDRTRKRGSGGTANKALPETRSSRSTSGAPRPSVNRMSRVGARDGQAVFKLIRSGGTTNRSGLRGQMNYIFNDSKLARVIDPTGRLKMENRVDPLHINKVIRNWSNSWWDNTRNGNTSHMILSYPASASIDQVENTTRDVLRELLQGGDRQFQYVAAVHDDKEHHPHVHVIVNRRAPDNTLFNLRSGTELSYERFREAMAEHGLKYGLELDPTFRFERGITARQPSYAEQRLAQAEQRAPEQRPRLDASLDYQRDLIDHAKIGYAALAVIAHNADCERISRAFDQISETLEHEGVNVEMPALSVDELQRFKQKKELFEDVLKKAQEIIMTRDSAQRVGAERQLDEVMRGFTALSSEADYAKALHRKPESNSIYMHGAGDRPEALTEPRVRQALQKIELDYGLSAEALTNRLPAGAPSDHLEQVWIKDDLEKIAQRDGLSLDTHGDQATALQTLNDAYSAARDTLVQERAIAYLPHLDSDREITAPDPDTYIYSPDRDAADLEEVLTYYRENGAPEIWIDENKSTIANILCDINKEREAAFVAAAPDSAEEYETIIARARSVESDLVESDLPSPGAIQDDQRLADAIRAQGGFDQADNVLYKTIGTDLAARHPRMPHHMIDAAAEARLSVLRLAELERDRDLSRDLTQPRLDPLAKFAERSPDGKALTRSDAERTELVRLVREHATEQELSTLRQGDITGLSRLTQGNETLARQIADAYKVEMRKEGVPFTPEMEQKFAENSQELTRAFPNVPGRDRGLEL